MTSKIANSIGSARGQQQGPVNADTPRYESGGGGGALPQPGTPRYGAHEEPEAATGPGTPRYGEGGEGPPSPTSAAAEKLADISIDVGGDSAAIAELAAEAARLAAETGLSLEASLAVETAKWRLRAAVGGEGRQPRCALAELHDAICSARSADAGHKSKWPQHMARAEKAAAPAVSRVLEAKGVVIDPNMCQLEQHMQRMREEQIGNAVGSMASGALRSVTRAKALAIHRCLMAALDDVEQQFVGGMEQFSRSGLPEHFRKQAVTRELCATAVHAHRLEMEAEYALLDIEQVLRERMVRELPDLKTLDLDSGKPPSMEQAPLSFLTAVVMGSAGLGVPAPIADWLGVQVGRYLDPFIDGDVEPQLYEKRSAGLFMTRLERAWKDPAVSTQELEMRAKCGASNKLPVSPAVALTAYVRHCITKMNTCMGFSAHIPGMGRQPLGAGEQERHVKQLGAALVAAIGRDFAAPHRSIASLPITANLVTELAQAHLRACVLYQNELSNALARANMEGEEARRQERMRIWGYSS